MNGGKIVIKTELDNSGVEKGLEEVKSIAGTEGSEAGENFSEKYSQALEGMNDAIAEKTHQLLSQLDELHEEYNQIEKSDILFDSDVERAEMLKQKMLEVIDELNKFTGQKIILKGITDTNKELDKTNIKLSKIGKGATNIGRTIMRWGLSLLGAYSVYGLIRSSMSTLSSYNDDMARKLQNIKLILAVALEPVVNRILDLVITLVNYLNYLTKAWFGLDLFARASELSTNKMAKNLSSGAGSAKEIKKQLAGFDEMNVLQDNSGSGAGGAGGGAGDDVPAFNIPEVKIPKWMEWIKKNGKLVGKGLELIGAGFLAMKFGLSVLQGVGLFLIIDGIINLLDAIKKFSEDPSIQNLGNIFSSLGEIVVGLAFLVGLTTPLGVILAIIGQLAIVIGGLFNWFPAIIDFIKNPSWENYVKTIKEGVKSMGLLGLAINWVVENVAGGWENVVGILKPAFDWINENLITPVKEGFENLFSRIEEIFTPIIEFFKTTFEDVYENIKISIDNIKILFTWLWDETKKIFDPVVTYFKEKFEKAVEKIKEKFSPIVEFFSGLWEKIKNTLKGWGEKVGQVVGGAFKRVINDVLNTIDDILNTPIRSINALIEKIRAVPGLSGLQELNTIRIPRLAKGGIVNLPGRGVPVGGALAGEVAPEGVIPLTDSQQMALLGEAIGKYININATIPVYVGNRQIARELRKIDAEDNFAFNR